jgi:hypothetical protein
MLRDSLSAYPTFSICSFNKGSCVLVWELSAHMGAIWEADGAIRELCVLYGSHVHWIGAIWEPDSTIWTDDGTIQESQMPLWEPQNQSNNFND